MSDVDLKAAVLEADRKEHFDKGFAAGQESMRQELNRVRAQKGDDYCTILWQWADLAVEQGIIPKQSVQEIRFAVSKSSYLGRRLYGGEEHRPHPCPVHKGKWSGLAFEPPPCGCDLTGWLHEPPESA